MGLAQLLKRVRLVSPGLQESVSECHRYLPRWMLDWCVLWVDSYVVLSFQATNSFLKHLGVLFNQFRLCDRLFSSAYCIYRCSIRNRFVVIQLMQARSGRFFLYTVLCFSSPDVQYNFSDHGKS